MHAEDEPQGLPTTRRNLPQNVCREESRLGRTGKWQKEVGMTRSAQIRTISAPDPIRMTGIPHLGDGWGMHDDSVQRTAERVEAALIFSGSLRLPGKKVLKEVENVFQIITGDATNPPSERPKKSSDAGTAGRTSGIPPQDPRGNQGSFRLQV